MRVTRVSSHGTLAAVQQSEFLLSLLLSIFRSFVEAIVIDVREMRVRVILKERVYLRIPVPVAEVV